MKIGSKNSSQLPRNGSLIHQLVAAPGGASWKWLPENSSRFPEAAPKSPPCSAVFRLARAPWGGSRSCQWLAAPGAAPGGGSRKRAPGGQSTAPGNAPSTPARIPSRTTEKKWQNRFSNNNTICCHGNQWSDLAEFQSHPSFYACPHCL